MSFELETDLNRLEGKLAMYKRHAVVRKVTELEKEIANVKAKLETERKAQVRLGDIPDLAPTVEKAAAERAKAAPKKPVSRRKPTAAKSTTESKGLDET